MNSTDTPGSSVALVIPTYNRADLIGETLHSALAQTRPFDQIIVVDNGSTDNTTEVVAAFGERVQLLRTDSIGVQAARNLGVQHAQTQRVVLCDSDDLLTPHYLAGVDAIFRAQPDLDAVYANFVNFSAQGTGPDKLSLAPAGWFDELVDQGTHWLGGPKLYAATLRFQPLFPSGSCLSRAFYLQLGGYSADFRGVGAEDWEFALRVCAQGKVALSKAPLLHIRRHEGNDSRNALHMSLGEVQILEHALQHHSAAASWRDAIGRSIDTRLHQAFDGAYAMGDFAQVADILRKCSSPPSGLRAWVKRLIAAAPTAVRTPLWKLTQGAASASSRPLRITVIEPAWDHDAHLPGNVGLLCVAAQAYPQARLYFVGGAAQIQAMRSELPPALLGRLVSIPWQAMADNHPTRQMLRSAMARWQALPAVVTEGADALILTSVTPTALAALARMGWAHKAVGMLHGNASELAGWRSRNPFSRARDLTASAQHYCRKGGRLSVLETRIATQLHAQLPWLQGRLLCLPHPLSPAEARPDTGARPLGQPLRIGFLGMGTRAKGLLDFLALAKRLRELAPGRFECHMVGMIHPSVADADPSALAAPPPGFLLRDEYIQALRTLDFGFVWHHDSYYAQAASGVVYDAINQLLPLVGRDAAQLSAWQQEDLRVALTFADVEAAARHLAQATPPQLAAEHTRAVADLAKLRETLQQPALARNLRQRLGELRAGAAG